VTAAEAHVEIANHCAEIADLFKPGAKVSVIVRNPGHGESHSADMFVSDDDPAKVIESLEYLKDLAVRDLGAA
jgi:hypothetical protein